MIKSKNIIIGVTVLAVVLSTGVAAFAATNTADGQTGKERKNIMADLTDTQRDAVMQARADSMKEAVTELVDQGTITQDVADKLPEVKMIVKDRGGQDLKDKGCQVLKDKGGQALTDEQRTALREEEKTVFDSKLADLVKQGTLTQDQVNQMEQGYKIKMSADLTDEQMQALMQAKIDSVKEAATNLVEKGTLTQAEADAITTAITAMPKIKSAEKPAGILTEEQGTALKEAMKTIFESKLSDLVDKGTITQDQADRLLNDDGPRFKSQQTDISL
jgi:polyhydroxyalkanoate synthesis regulator phasin